MTANLKNNTKNILEHLGELNIKTWYDIGIFLDKLEDGRFTFISKPKKAKSFSDYIVSLKQGSVGFVTYELGVDGVSTETIKYINVLKKILGNDFRANIVVGNVNTDAEVFKTKENNIPIFIIPEAAGFEKWGDIYRSLFYHPLHRGSEGYNRLPKAIWNLALKIFNELSLIIEKTQTKTLILSNVASNPGNLSLTLAIVMLSEFLCIPILNVNHDFYWEGGKSSKLRVPGEKRGPRDHFFTNVDIGEFFSIIKLLYPWRGKFWTQININSLQSEHLINEEGINPTHVTEIGSSIDLTKFHPLTNFQKENAFLKLKLLFRYNESNNFIVEPSDKKVYTNALSGTPFLIGKSNTLQFAPNSTLVFLQPTRIIDRKQIEKNFDVMIEFLKNNEFVNEILKNKQIIILITGPVADGHFDYYRIIQQAISEMFSKIRSNVQKNIFIGFLFGKDTNDTIVQSGLVSLRIEELYGISSLTLLLSQTEGRGLPIIESSAMGIPLLVNRFTPFKTFDEVTEKLNVYLWNEKDKQHSIKPIVDLLLHQDLLNSKGKENRKVVLARFGGRSFTRQWKNILKISWNQLHTVRFSKHLAKMSLKYVLSFRKNKIEDLIFANKRKYIPGYNFCGFLFYLKSLVDPTFFRIEQLDLRKRIYSFACELVNTTEINSKKQILFFRALSQLFSITEGHNRIIFDHSFNYRNRTNRTYLFHQLTENELYGVVIFIYRHIFGHASDPLLQSGKKESFLERQLSHIRSIDQNAWKDKLRSLFLNIDAFNLNKFEEKILKKPTDIVFFLEDNETGLLDLKILVEDVLLATTKNNIKTRFYLVVSKNPFANTLTENDIYRLLNLPILKELLQFVLEGKVIIISENIYSSGINLYQISEKLRHILLNVISNDGVILSRGENNFVTLDLINCDSFRFGKVVSDAFSHFSGLDMNTTFFQFIPAGIRPIINYPVPTQQLKDFNKSIKSIVDNQATWKQIRDRQDETGVSIKTKNQHNDKIVWSHIANKHSDGFPWTGVQFEVKSDSLHLDTIFVTKRTASLRTLVQTYQAKTKRRVLLGFNGGFILNSELVGKLGLTEEYIGTPLGLVIQNGKVRSLPLYNRPILAYTHSRELVIARQSLPPGSMSVLGYKKESCIAWSEDQINVSGDTLLRAPLYVYNLFFNDAIPYKNRTLVTICGNRIISIFPNEESWPRGKKNTELPVGVTFSFSRKLFKDHFSKYYKVNAQVDFDLLFTDKLQNIKHAVGAGPLLINDNKICLNMDIEGWTTLNSIRTQAARIDQINQRGPKIGVGINKLGSLVGIVINGRTRDSFGSTYSELAVALKNMGAVTAMALDPGGSASLLINDNIVNISPYNSRYNNKIYYAKPQPREIGSAIVFTL